MTNFYSKFRLSFVAITLSFFTLIWPVIINNTLFDIIVNIRTSITSGDSGLLIVTTIGCCILFMLPSFLTYISLESLYTEWRKPLLAYKISRPIFIGFCFSCFLGITQVYRYYPIEPVTSFIGLLITFVLVRFSSCKPDALLPKMFIAVQVFLLSQWANIVASLTQFHIGVNDLSVSLKVASAYLDHLSTINKIALSFMIPLFLSSFMTAFIIKLYNQNLTVARANFQNELAVKAMQKKIMTNRTYQEINALAHDLKTPLVTIQGLTSLLMLTKETEKIDSYGHTINEAIQKMTDMISSFLYGNMKESIEISDLVNYIRTQIPVEDDDIHFEVEIEKGLPPLYINKIRMARALINLVENAILAPKTEAIKTIKLSAHQTEDFLIVSLSDNGVGIKSEDLEKIWTIGYSSKETSGLGLPFAKQTVQENNGILELSSSYGKGTTANIYFPIYAGKERSDSDAKE